MLPEGTARNVTLFLGRNEVVKKKEFSVNFKRIKGFTLFLKRMVHLHIFEEIPPSQLFLHLQNYSKFCSTLQFSGHHFCKAADFRSHPSPRVLPDPAPRGEGPNSQRSGWERRKPGLLGEAASSRGARAQGPGPGLRQAQWPLL